MVGVSKKYIVRRSRDPVSQIGRATQYSPSNLDVLLPLFPLVVSMSSSPREIGTLIVVVLKAVGSSMHFFLPGV